MPSDLILAAATVAQMAMTGGLVFYAAMTIQEARKDRRRCTIERRLEKIYFPMFEILNRARLEGGQRAMVRSEPVSVRGSDEAGHLWSYVLSPEESEQIRDIIQRFGYYLGATELRRLRSDLETASIGSLASDTVTVGAAYVRLRTDVFDNHWRHFKSRCDMLTAELEGLTGVMAE